MSTAKTTLSTSSKVGGLFSNLTNSLHISLQNLYIIGIACVAGTFLLVVIIIILIKKNDADKKNSKKGKKDTGYNLNIDFAKYESPYGYIDFTIMYDKKKKSLKVQSMTVCNLPNSGNSAPDIYVKIFLKNEDGRKMQLKQTKTVYDNTCPTFPEIFSLKIEELQFCVIHFQVFDENKNGNDCPVGDGVLVLDDIPRECYLGFVYPTYTILCEPSEMLGCGDVCVILTFTTPKIHISVLEAKNMKFQYTKMLRKDMFVYPTVYAVVKLFINHRKKKTYKTRSVSNTRNPYFFESFSHNIVMKDLECCVIKIELHEYTPGRIPRRVGRAVIGKPKYHPLINDLGKQHHSQMCENWKNPQAMWHALIKG